MSESNVKKVEFSAGFENVESKDGLVKVYKDADAYVNNAPLKKAEIKSLNEYTKGFNSDFLAASIEASKQDFKEDGKLEKVTYQAQNGVGARDTISVHVTKLVEYKTNFGGEEKVVKVPKVTVVSRASSTEVSGTVVKEQKESLLEFLKSNGMA